ncbi:MAG: hypothetical protein ACOYMZ_01770 [Minisyncoccia bacterium]
MDSALWNAAVQGARTFKKYWNHIGRYGLYTIFSNAIDYGLYSVFYLTYGLIAVPYIVTATLLIDIITAYIYLYKGIDFLGINSLASTIEVAMANEKPSRWWVIRVWQTLYCFALRVRSSWWSVILLSVEFNPFMVMIIAKQQKITENSMTLRDKTVFAVSFVVGNVWWAIVMIGFWECVKNIAQWIGLV